MGLLAPALAAASVGAIEQGMGDLVIRVGPGQNQHLSSPLFRTYPLEVDC
jgi:hypothetical protein